MLPAHLMKRVRDALCDFYNARFTQPGILAKATQVTMPKYLKNEGVHVKHSEASGQYCSREYAYSDVENKDAAGSELAWCNTVSFAMDAIKSCIKTLLSVSTQSVFKYLPSCWPSHSPCWPTESLRH